MRPTLRHGLPAFIVLALAACGTAGTLPPAASESAVVTASPSVRATARPSLAACPNAYGGVCIGPLAAGTYGVELFESPFTYTVGEGWGNYEDLPGNFLLVPPGASLGGTDAGEADYVGMYDGAVAASADCREVAQDGADPSPRGMASWFRQHDGLDASKPQPVEVGGLEGFVMDIRLASDWSGTCPYPGYEDTPMVPMLIGSPPASLHHVVLGDTVTRLYLLDGPMDRTITIELSDTPGGASMDEMDAVVQTFEFAS